MEDQTAPVTTAPVISKASNLAALKASYGTDQSAEEGGAWMPVPDMPGMRLKLRSMSSRIVRNFAQKQQRKYMALYQAKKSPTVEQTDADSIELLAKVVVVAWEGFDDLACSPANVAEVLTELPRIRELVERWADERENFRAQAEGAIQGN